MSECVFPFLSLSRLRFSTTGDGGNQMLAKRGTQRKRCRSRSAVAHAATVGTVSVWMSHPCPLQNSSRLPRTSKSGDMDVSSWHNFADTCLVVQIPLLFCSPGSPRQTSALLQWMLAAKVDWTDVAQDELRLEIVLPRKLTIDGVAKCTSATKLSRHVSTESGVVLKGSCNKEHYIGDTRLYIYIYNVSIRGSRVW